MEKKQENNHVDSNLSDNIRNFVKGMSYVSLDNLGFLARHIREQAIYRAWLCRDCLVRKKCVGCGCATPALFYAPDKTDSNGKWSRMLAPAQWEQKKMEDFKFKEFLAWLDSEGVSLNSNNIFDVIATKSSDS